MIRRVLRWVPALRALNPLNPKNGWARVRRGGFQLMNIYENTATNKIGGFRGMRDENGDYRLHCVVLKNTPENKKAILGGLASAARVDKIAINFVVMWSFVNQSDGATNRHLAKHEYVSLDLANEIRDTAVEVLRGVRACVSA